jgi:hypothetical protein
MPAPTLNSFKAVQDFLNEVITQNGTGISSAKHGAFWTNWTNKTNTTYTEFTTGKVPNVSPPVRILIPKNSAQSNIIMALRGEGPLFGSTGSYGQMPADGTSYFTPDQVNAIAAWIDAGCPE